MYGGDTIELGVITPKRRGRGRMLLRQGSSCHSLHLKLYALATKDTFTFPLFVLCAIRRIDSGLVLESSLSSLERQISTCGIIRWVVDNVVGRSGVYSGKVFVRSGVCLKEALEPYAYLVFEHPS